MPEFTLYGFSESGNAYKAALMLELCGADWAVERVAFFSGETRTPEYRELNVMGEAPVLVHHRKDGDFRLSQSGSILVYLSRHFGRFGHEMEAEEYEILRWILFDNHKLTSYSATARFMRHMQKKFDDPAALFIHARARNAWKVLDTHLVGREWVAAERPHHRRHLPLRLPVLARSDRRRLERLSPYTGLARAPAGFARMGYAGQADALGHGRMTGREAPLDKAFA